jgi:hypothetical protein
LALKEQCLQLHLDAKVAAFKGFPSFFSCRIQADHIEYDRLAKEQLQLTQGIRDKASRLALLKTTWLWIPDGTNCLLCVCLPGTHNDAIESSKVK